MLHQLQIHLIPAQHHIRAALAVEVKGTLSLFIQLYEVQRGWLLRALDQTGDVDSVSDQCLLQKPAEAILAHFANKGGLLPQNGQHSQHIGRRTARIAGHQCRSLPGDSRRGKVNQEFSQCNNISHYKFPSPSLKVGSACCG